MSEDPSLFFLFLSLMVLLFLSGFFSGSETGMMAANKVKLRNRSKKYKDKGAKRALKLLKKPDLLLSTILIGNNFANILASAIVTLIMIDYFGGNVVLGSIALTIVILIFSEITPKTMAAVKPEKFATFSSFFLKILLYVFKPIIKIINSVSSIFLKLFRLNLKDAKNNDNLNTEELKTLLEESGNLIPKQFRSVLSSVLEMDELIVEDVMIPANEIVGIDINENFDKALKIIESAEYTRLPVFKENIDSIEGILHLKDSHNFLEHFDNRSFTKTVLNKIFYVSQSTALMKQLSEFQKNNTNMAMVVDEYGEIQGLITLEDIFKEIVGKYSYTKNDPYGDFIKLKNGYVLCEGNSRIRDLNKFLNWNLPENGSKTINGLIVDILDQIPQRKLCLEIGGYRLEIIDFDENSILKIKIKKGD